MATLTVPDTIKMLRETLCVAQTAITHTYPHDPHRDEHIARLQRLANDCDRQRPLDPNGTHNHHTPTCGCEPNNNTHQTNPTPRSNP